MTKRVVRTSWGDGVVVVGTVVVVVVVVDVVEDVVLVPNDVGGAKVDVVPEVVVVEVDVEEAPPPL